jgi:uncharacterized repeat protein (TIGR04138 family)
MNEEAIALARILRKDQRYSPDAYFFIREALSYAADKLELRDCHCDRNADELGQDASSCCGFEGADFDDSADPNAPVPMPETHAAGSPEDGEEQVTTPQRHVTGQQLCEGIREYALSQFGLMAKVVLNSWGIQSTSDFGEIVYNLIRVGVLKKSSRDRRAHFNDVYDFEHAFDSPEAVSEAFPSKLATLR